MKTISLFSGIGGFDLGFQNAGMDIVSSCDNDTSCRNILSRHFPNSTLYDDVRKVGVNTHERNSIDIIVGGFPCQDLSVAGKRKGLVGERSGLWFEFARVIDELEPRWFVIENVPGLLSSDEGKDFAIILRWLAERGYGVCWRVLDSQYFGVAQRRRRVFIVGSFGNGSSAQVLFESEGGAGYITPGREAWQGTTPDIVGSLDSGGSGSVGSHGGSWPGTTVQSMSAGHSWAQVFQQNERDEVRLMGGDGQITGALQAEAGMKQQNYVMTLGHTKSNGSGIGFQSVRNTLEAVGSSNQAVLQRTDGALQARDAKGIGSTIDDKIVSFSHRNSASRSMTVHDNQSPTLESQHTGVSIQNDMGVRRLTPTECERLQGFPDGWTDGQSDSARYRQLGNAITVPVIEWIAKRIKAVG